AERRPPCGFIPIRFHTSFAPKWTGLAMTTILCRARRFQRILCLTLTVAIVTAPSVSVLAQTNAAAMSVRQRFEGTSPEGPEAPQPQQQPQGVPGPGPGQPVPAELSLG